MHLFQAVDTRQLFLLFIFYHKNFENIYLVNISLLSSVLENGKLL